MASNSSSDLPSAKAMAAPCGEVDAPTALLDALNHPRRQVGVAGDVGLGAASLKPRGFDRCGERELLAAVDGPDGCSWASTVERRASRDERDALVGQLAYTWLRLSASSSATWSRL